MKSSSEEPSSFSKRKRAHPECPRGFTLIEIMISLSILVIGILGIATMFGTGYHNVGEGGRMTMAVAAARQMLEDVRLIPFANLANLDRLDTNTPGSQPANNPERDIARKWAYGLVGNTVAGWNFSSTETAAWRQSGAGTGTSAPPVSGARGQVTVTTPAGTTNLRQITVTITDPRGRTTVQLTTLISRL